MYSKEEIKNFNNKDKRIAFLSIFSSLCTKVQGKELETIDVYEASITITDKLYTKYPIYTAEDALPNLQERKTEDMAGLCPTCNSLMLVKSGVKNGKQWKGKFCSKKGCSNPPIWLPKDNEPY